MKTTLRNIAMTIGLTAVLGSASLFAETVSKATIPFDFQITGKTVPAGRYIVKLSDNHQILSFQNGVTGHTCLTLVLKSKSGMRETGVLAFRHSGERYTLDSVWFAGTPGGYDALHGTRDRAASERGALTMIRLLQK